MYQCDTTGVESLLFLQDTATKAVIRRNTNVVVFIVEVFVMPQK
jgi:hypothetical protein